MKKKKINERYSEPSLKPKNVCDKVENGEKTHGNSKLCACVKKVHCAL